MRIDPTALSAAVLASLCIASAPAWSQAAQPARSYIVVLKAQAGLPEMVAKDIALAHGGRVGYIYEHVLKGFSVTLPITAVAGVANRPDVAYIERDLPMSIIAQAVPTGIRRSFAAQNPNLDIDGSDDLRVDVDVAVLDTGIDIQHPDLNVAGGANCLQSIGSGPPWARTFFCDPGVSADDDHYHGTHVAGTIGALDNNVGVVGVAPGARLWAVKVLDGSGSGYTSGIVAGIDWVAGRGDIEVINMSLGGSGVSTAYKDAIDSAVGQGVVVVVAAGNSDADAKNFSPAFVPSAITVSALADFDGLPGGTGSPTCRTDVDDTLADFSNWGSVIDIAAPGVCILSTFPLERGEYGTISGTSMASPHVAGAAALLASGGNAPHDTAGVQAIRNTLVNKGNANWTDDSGDGVKEALLDLSDTLVFAPTMVAGSGGGGGGTTNTPPAASFDYSCSGLTCNFVDTSTDADGSVVSRSWNFGDGATSTASNPSHTYAADGTYTVTLTVTDNGGATASVSPSVTVQAAGSGAISLSVRAYKVKGVQRADLTWSGATTANVDVYRNDALIIQATNNDGAETDNIGAKGGGTYTYRLCDTNTPNICSAPVTIVF